MMDQMQIFDSKYSVDGSLSNGEDVIDGIQADITYNDIGNNQPSITLRGPADIRKNVLNIIMKGEPHFTGEWIRKGYSYKIIFSSYGALNLSFSPEGDTNIICRYDCKELIVEDIWKAPEIYKPINIALSIDYSLPPIAELSRPIDLIREAENHGIHVAKMEYDTPIGSLSIRNLKKSASTTICKREGSFQYIDTTLHFESTDERIDHITFLKDADSIVQDYLDVISMVTQRRIQYYKVATQYYSSEPIDSFRTHKFYYREDFSPRRRIFTIQWQEMDRLLNEIVQKYSIHTDKQAIHHTLDLFLTGVQSRVAETRLIWIQNAIEVVIDHLDVSVERCVECGMQKKSLKDRLFTLANLEPSYFIDIYPTLFEGQQIKKDLKMTFPFIRIRNELTHGGITNFTHDFIDEELDRQQLLFERLLYKWIHVDYKNISYLFDKTFFKPWSGDYPLITNG